MTRSKCKPITKAFCKCCGQQDDHYQDDTQSNFICWQCWEDSCPTEESLLAALQAKIDRQMKAVRTQISDQTRD